MNIHEYQAKELFRESGVAVLPAKAFTKETLSIEAIRSIAKPPFVVKAQIHAGGRGKAGGIKTAVSAETAFEAAKGMLGSKLVTYQTGGAPKPVDSVLIEASRPIKQELYLAVTLDREALLPCVICSKSGGVDIEEIASTAPEKILKAHFEPELPVQPECFRGIAEKLFDSAEPNALRLRMEAAGLIAKVAALAVKLDATIVEINPLGWMADGSLVPIDAKINFDDNALFRHPQVADLLDARQEDEREIEAKKFDLSYVGLEGSIGCMVNGAGLAMATMDIIQFKGGRPANFCDVGGGASKEKVAAAFKIILKDPRVRAILVNIFGGIMRCDVLAEGIVAAQKEAGLKVPLVARLEGTNVEAGRRILKDSGITVMSADTFDEAAVKAVRAVIPHHFPNKCKESESGGGGSADGSPC